MLIEVLSHRNSGLGEEGPPQRNLGSSVRQYLIKHQNEWQLNNKDNTNLDKGWQNEEKWRQLGGVDPPAMPQPGGCGQAAQGSLQTLMPLDKWHQFLGQKRDQHGRQNNQGVNKNWETGRGIKQFCSGHKQCVLVTRHTREGSRPTGTQRASSTGSGAGWRPRSTKPQKWRERSSKKKLSTVPNAAYHR